MDRWMGNLAEKWKDREVYKQKYKWIYAVLDEWVDSCRCINGLRKKGRFMIKLAWITL